MPIVNRSRRKLILIALFVVCLLLLAGEVLGVWFSYSHWRETSQTLYSNSTERVREDKYDLCPKFFVPEGTYIRPARKGFDWSKAPLRFPVKEYAKPSPWTPTPPPRIEVDPPILDAGSFSIQDDRRDTIRKTFQRAWSNYRMHAWKSDELKPVTAGPSNPFGGWGATLVDSLDTLWIMGMHDEFREAVEAVETISFAPNLTTTAESSFADPKINVFETIIRYIGGLLSAYEVSACKYQSLLDKAVELGDMVYVAFDTPSHMPINSWDPVAGARGEHQLNQYEQVTAPLATIGTLSLEFTKLSMLTGDMKFYDTSERINNLLEDVQMRTSIPGLWPRNVDLTRIPSLEVAPLLARSNYSEQVDRAFRGSDIFSMGGESDSAYEYILKMVMLLGADNPASQRFLRMYERFVDAQVKNGMFFRPLAPGNPDVLLLGSVMKQRGSKDAILVPSMEHLACFAGGMLGLGSRLLPSDSSISSINSTSGIMTTKQPEDSLQKNHMELSQRFTDGCAWSYAQTATGIAPESFGAHPCSLSSGSRGECLWNETVPATDPTLPPGYTSILDSRYHLRPEAIESVFYLYRLTGQHYLQDVAWEIFEAIDGATRTVYGNAEIENVNRKDGGGKANRMESFWMAETLKYFYLIFEAPEGSKWKWSLEDWVFNTEAHPFRVPR